MEILYFGHFVTTAVNTRGFVSDEEKDKNKPAGIVNTSRVLPGASFWSVWFLQYLLKAAFELDADFNCRVNQTQLRSYLTPRSESGQDSTLLLF